MTVDATVDYLKRIIMGSERYINRQNYIGEFFLISTILDKRNRIISIGENSLTKTHPLMNYYSNKSKVKHKIYLHAEMSALVKAYDRGYTLIVIRLNRRGNLAMAKPCPLCEMAIKEAGIKEVHYSTQESTMGVQYYG